MLDIVFREGVNTLPTVKQRKEHERTWFAKVKQRIPGKGKQQLRLTLKATISHNTEAFSLNLSGFKTTVYLQLRLKHKTGSVLGGRHVVVSDTI